jgi:hypothetical protein
MAGPLNRSLALVHTGHDAAPKEVPGTVIRTISGMLCATSTYLEIKNPELGC